MRIFLIGYMGSGKTTLGRELADRLRFPFVDLDSYIEEKERRSIPRIFEDGEDYFRHVERQYLEEVTEANPDCVVACGGGTACRDENISYLREQGKTIFLDVSVQELSRRLKDNMEARPLLSRLGPDEVAAFIATSLDGRRKYYSRADISVVSDHIDGDQLLAALKIQ